MWARGRFDISWADLAYGALCCARPGGRSDLPPRVERLWSPAGDALACYSVRSAFDLLLRSLRLPPGSEVLFSALNVTGMIRVVERLGLVPVPVDLDLDHLAPRPEMLERAITARSRVLLVAHLFGARIDLAPLLAVARRHRLFVVEDCAQAFDGLGDTGHPDADVSLFSFGPLKTATALGGALARVADPALRERMRRAQERYPVHARRAYLRRIVRFLGLKSLTYRWTAAGVFLVTRVARADLDRRLEVAARRLTREKGPSRPRGPSQKLHHQPSVPMLALLARRLSRAPERRIEARTRAGRALLDGLAGALVCPGTANLRHGFWLFPVLAKDPGALFAALRSAGFDAAPMVSLRSLPAPADRPDLEPVVACEFLAQVVILPCYAAMGTRALARQAAVVRRAAGAFAPESERPRAGRVERLRAARRRGVKRLGKWLIRRLGDFQGRQSLVGDPAIFDADLFPAVRRLESHWRKVRAEIDAVLEDREALPGLRDISPDQRRIATDARWKAFVLYGFGFRADRNCDRCPETSRLLEAVPGLENAWFSILAPGYCIPAHRGITKGLINCLLGLKVPRQRNACRIRVGEELRAFAEGEAFVFDDTVTHEIWNETPEERVVLIVSFRRPMRWPGRLLNAVFLAAFKRTGYVLEARDLFRGWEDRFYADGASPRRVDATANDRRSS